MSRSARPRFSARTLLGAVACSGLLVGGPGLAHDFTLTDTLVVVRGDGQFHVDMICDLDALALGVPSGSGSAGHEGTLLAHRLAALDEETIADVRSRLQRLFERRVRIRFDGEPLRHSVSFPDTLGDEGRRRLIEGLGEAAGTPGELAAESRQGAAEEEGGALPESYFGVTARLSGEVPTGAETMTFFASRAFQSVHLTVAQQRASVIRRQALVSGEESDPIELVLAAEPPPVDEVAGTGTEAGRSGWATFTDYLELGFVHIVPRGSDHILFVLSLTLLSTSWRALAVWVTCFTIGHSVSLALASLGWMSAEPGLVEPLIAVSIGWVAFRALRRLRRDGREPSAEHEDEGWGTGRSEAWVVLALGLLHGFGFAGVLAELGLPTGQWLLGLVGFNLGVEVGQIVVLAGSLLVLGVLSRGLGRGPVVRVVAWGLLLVSAYWTLERTGLLPIA